ncbi:hypothetical protein HPB47_026057 [Ixodes persulcatus]|uniref:Uncharacterized protein n=1 Tax=Ixodes persulcatus TaxID=34615 RepID=A0AC60Q118_IXOPE|nr:hypothetical protein HPB47_026057 [Ixodes persulcatus]
MNCALRAWLPDGALMCEQVACEKPACNVGSPRSSSLSSPKTVYTTGGGTCDVSDAAVVLCTSPCMWRSSVAASVSAAVITLLTRRVRPNIAHFARHDTALPPGDRMRNGRDTMSKHHGNASDPLTSTVTE